MTNYSRSVLKSNGLRHLKNLPVKFGFSPQIVPANIVQKLPSQRCSKPLLIAFFNFSHKWFTFAFTDESGYTLGFRRKIAHNGLHAETGAFPPPATAGLCVASEIAPITTFATLDSATLLYTYISRFSVTPHLSAEEKYPAKLPSQLCSKPLFIAFFNFSHKRPTFAFTGESGYTLGFQRKIAHSGSHGETGGLPLCRHSMALCCQRNRHRKNSRRKRMHAYVVCPLSPASRPAGLRDLFLLLSKLWLTHHVVSAFRMCETRGGITTLGVLCVLPKLPAPAC